ncbi:MAG: leucine-rich repeat domain-containing protein [Treponema sp.]|jgi:hypothetical protein|nr:leucine-rich repeat domain-containing protein [Treponema sp.]
MKYLKRFAICFEGLFFLAAFVFSGCDHSNHRHELGEGAVIINPITSLEKVKMEGVCITCGYTGTGYAPLSEYLRQLPENDASTPYNLVINVDALPDLYDFWKLPRYASLDFSGSTFTSIGSRDFSNCTSLTGITIPNSVTVIGDGSFSGCWGLTSVIIGDSVTVIGDGSFSGCWGLTSVIIPDSVTFIGDSAFYSCSGLTSVTFEGSIFWRDFDISAFQYCGDLRDKFYATNPSNGTPGTYTTANLGGDYAVWTRQP